MVHTENNEEVGALTRWRPWHPVAHRLDRFHWLLGLRVSLGFVGPFVIAHVLGWGRADMADVSVMALAGLLVALIGNSLPSGRRRILPGLALAAVLPLVCVLHGVVDPHSASGVAVIGLSGLLAGLAPLVSPVVAVITRSAALGLVITTELPTTAHAAWMLVMGGAVALLILFVTEPLAHPRLGLPPLPGIAARPVHRIDVVRHAVRLAVTLLGAAALAEWVGHGSVFAAHSSWMLLGVWIAMQPHHEATRDAALQRGLGTLVGAVPTLLLAMLLPGSLWLGYVFLVLAFVAFGLRTVNYAWYCVGLTPIVVLGFFGTDLNAQVLVARLVWTAVGVTVALVGRWLFWSASADRRAVEFAS